MSKTPDNFLGLEPKYCDPKKSRFHILPIPYDVTASYMKGTRKGPKGIIKASQQVEYFDEILHGEFYQAGIFTAPQITCQHLSAEKLQEKIYDRAEPVIKNGKFLFSLGGEHSVTPALVKAYKKYYPKLSLLHIDAHADLRDEYHNTKFSHACAMRRVYDMGVPFVQVGIRSMDQDQHEFIQKHKLKVLTPWMINKNPNWIKQVLAGLTDDVYISFDIDGLDPAYAPGTGTPEPGGLSYPQVVEMILAVGKKKKIVGADIVEVVPNISGVVTEFLAARLAYKIIAAAQL